MGQKVCSPGCAIRLAKSKTHARRNKQIREETRKRKEALKTKSDYRREAQSAFNAYIRERDRNRGCISCGTTTAGQYHAGHYRTRKAAPQLAFDCLNVHKQCAQCNLYDSGNVSGFRLGLVAKLGEDRVLALEHNNASANHTTDYLKRLKAVFTKRTRHIKRIRASKSTRERDY